jgi:hypothetical protein
MMNPARTTWLCLSTFTLLGACTVVSDEDVANRTTTLTDADGDGFVSLAHGGDDCDDTDANVNTGPTWYADTDGDGFGDAAVSVQACDAPAAHVSDATDCDDSSALALPGGTEVCGDGLDNDCSDGPDDSGAVDASTWYADTDEDLFGDPDVSLTACTVPDAHVADNTDCDDAVATTHPGAIEHLQDDVDSDCDEGNDTVRFVPVDTDGHAVSQGPVIARVAGLGGGSFHLAWTTETCGDRHDCTFVETRSGDDLAGVMATRQEFSSKTDQGDGDHGFDFVANSTHFGWARTYWRDGTLGFELEGYSLTDGSRGAVFRTASVPTSVGWDDLEVSLDGDELTAVACGYLLTGTPPGTRWSQVSLADLATGAITEDDVLWQYLSASTCEYDTSNGNFYMNDPLYGLEWWEISYGEGGVPTNLTQIGGIGGYSIPDFESKEERGVAAWVFSNSGWGSLYVSISHASPTPSVITVETTEQPTQLDFGVTEAEMLLICAVADNGEARIHYLDPSQPSSEDVLLFEGTLSADVPSVDDCAIGINGDNEALVVFRSGFDLYEARVSVN